jgi:hypothetical protein
VEKNIPKIWAISEIFIAQYDHPDPVSHNVARQKFVVRVNGPY